MITLEKASEIILEYVSDIITEYVSIEDSLGRVISQKIVSDTKVPQADMSAMDGFACIYSERDKKLKVIETIAAGYVPQKKIEPGTCSRIMTGAMVPPGADCVVMFEHTQEENGFVTVTKLTDKKNIRYCAEDINVGDIVIEKGTLISTAIYAVLATAGIINIPVAKKPTVGIIATGDELVEPQFIPSGAKIRNSNSYQLYAQSMRCGSIPKYYGIANDTARSTRELIDNAIKYSDVILVSGGVSAGDFDCVPQALKDSGFDLFIESIAIKPGKPAVFGKKGDVFAFGMPGNPVSTFVLFELLVRPFLQKMMGHCYSPVIVKTSVCKDIRKKKGDRLEIIPVKINSDGTAEKVDYHGSAHIHAYAVAHGFIALDQNTESIPAGTTINVQLIEK